MAFSFSPSPQQQQQQLFIFTNDKTPATYNTKWADIHPDSQKYLLQVEERILVYRDESQRLDQCGRLYDSPDGFEVDAGRIVQELGGISTSMERERAILQELRAGLKDMMRNTDIAVRSFIFIRPNGSNASATTQATRNPSPFLCETVARFENYMGECQQRIQELEQLLLSYSNNGHSSGPDSSSLPKVMSDVHKFFVHVAAKVENLHQYTDSTYLAHQRRRDAHVTRFCS